MGSGLRDLMSLRGISMRGSGAKGLVITEMEVSVSPPSRPMRVEPSFFVMVSLPYWSEMTLGGSGKR